MTKRGIERTIVQPEALHFLEAYGYAKKHGDALTCPYCHRGVVPTKGGRADYICVASGQGMAVEVKARRALNFPFSALTKEQREWAQWFRDISGAEWWLFLSFGTARPNSNAPDRRRAWIIPWEAWSEVEARLRPIQASLPLYVRSGLRREIQQSGLVAVLLLSPWELVRVRGGWQAPQDHQFHRMYGGGYDR